MKEGKIVIVEGTSCVGKTTLCKNLEQQGWTVLPEAVRYIEENTGKKGDEASPIPISQKEEEYYQDQLLEIEMKKLIEANKLKKQGKNVILDKSAIATVATAKAFEEQRGFKETFKRAYNKYINILKILKEKELIECDFFILLTADYETIIKRNQTRNHKLGGIWTEEKTIEEQRDILEKITNKIIGNLAINDVEKATIDTTKLTKEEVLEKVSKIINKQRNIKEEIEK